MDNKKYIFVIVYIEGNEQEFQHEGSYASMKQRYRWLKENKEIAKVSVFELIPQQINTVNW